jgi:hypothetical protein
MRILKLNLLAVALLLFGATNASAFAINMVARGATSSLTVSDTVTVDVFFDATQTGILLFGTNVLNSNASVISYDPVATQAAPAFGSAGGGAQPSYILYDPGMGGMPPTPPVALYPQQTPTWLTFPVPPPGQQQVAINYAEINITDTFNTRTTGNGIWIATIVFHVDQPFLTEFLTLSMHAAGSILELGSGVVNPDTIGLSAPIVLTGHLPEPTTAMLMGLGLLGLAISGRRK